MWRDQLKARALGISDSIAAAVIIAVAAYGGSAAIAWYSAHAFQLAGFGLHWAIVIGVVVFLAIAIGLNLISLVIVRHRKQGTDTHGETPQHLAAVAPHQSESTPPKPEPYLICVAARPTRASVGEKSGWVNSGKRSVEAITGIFKNTSNQTLRYVTARITYYRADGSFYHQVNKGEWLNEKNRYVEFFGAHENRELMLAWRLSEREVYASGDRDRENLNAAGNQIRVEVNFVASIHDAPLQRIDFKLTLEPNFSIEQIANAALGGAVKESQPGQLSAPNVEEMKDRIRELERGQSELTSLKTRYRWLDDIAEEDKEDISKAVFVVLKDVSNRLTDSIPRIYFTFTAFNGSVYSLSVEPSVEGEIRCRKQSLMGAMKVNGFKDLTHGCSGEFTLTFEPTQAGANFILEAQKSGEDWFWFDQLAIKVSAGKEVESKRLRLPEDIYSTNTKDRIKALKARHESEKIEWRRRAEIIATLSVVLGMGEELIHAYRLSNRVPPEHIEEWRRRLEVALRRCYDERGLAKFYPFPYEGTVLEGPKPTYPQERWFDDYMERLRQLIAAEYDGPTTD